MGQQADPPGGRALRDPLAQLLGGLLAATLARIFLALVPPRSAIETGVWILLVLVLGALLGCAAWQRSAQLIRAVMLWGVGGAGVLVGIGYPAALAMQQ